MNRDGFSLAVIGDFGGQPGDERRFLSIDRDRFDAVMARLAVRVELTVPNLLLPGAGQELRVSLAPRSIDDLTPDEVVRAVPALAAVLKARQAGPPASRPVAAPPAPSRDRSIEPDSLLDRILGAGREAERGNLPPALEDFVQAVTEPLVDRTDQAAVAAWRDAIDRRLAGQVGAILHHPRFQAVEAAWRGLQALVQAAETGPDLTIRVLDLPRVELPRASIDDGLLSRLICEEAETPGALPYAAIVADYAFGADEADLQALGRLGNLAARAAAPLVAVAHPGLLGLGDFRELGSPAVRGTLGTPALRALRSDRVAHWIALCLPRVLLRAPYGPDGESTAAFQFDEGLRPTDHEHFLWGSPALALAQVLVRAFAEDGWNLDPTRVAGLSGLPVHVYREQGEDHVLPCAEVVMSEATIARVVEEGCIALGSIRDSDEARFYGIQTLAGEALRVRAPA